MRRLGFFRFLLQTSVAVALLCSLSFADQSQSKVSEGRASLAPSAVETPRFTLFFPNSEQGAGIPLNQLAQSTLSILNETYEELSSQFHVRPAQKVVFRFLTPEEFRKHTGAPAWTSAMYLRGEVSIPVSKTKRLNPTELRRAIRHEYTHAVVAELSGKHCPAWLDEGLAQMMEGDVNPLLGPALRHWASDNSEAMPLTWLQNGFMTLNENIVPAAYAQSLFSTRLIVKRLGYQPILNYLSALRGGMEQSSAFRSAFRVTEREFEQTLASEIALWANGSSVNP